MIVPPLSATTTGVALAHLGIAAAPPTERLLHDLVTAYTRRVPWESASRIVRRATRDQTSGRPQWPHDFWAGAQLYGTGGTCYESNYAFFTLLLALGYEGYLTINDMHASVGCHTAIVVRLGGQKWLVDVGMPLYEPVPFDAAGGMATGQFHTVTVRPIGEDIYEIERDRHPRPYCFTLHDCPVSAARYRDATINDYAEHGLFLDRLIVTKVVGGQISRFDSGNPDGPCITTFYNGERTDAPLPADPTGADTAVAAHFGIDAGVLRDARNALSAR